MKQRRALWLALGSLALGADAARGAALSGQWETAGATLVLFKEGADVVGRLARDGGPCRVPVGTELLRGTLLDDSLSARVRLCLVAAPCGDEPGTALAVLLVTRQLTGGVHSRQPCAAGARSLVLRRPGAVEKIAAPDPVERLSRAPLPKSPRLPPSLRTRGPTLASARPPRTQAEPAGSDQRPRYDVRMARRPAPDSVEGLLRRGAERLVEGRFEQARRSFRDALALDPRRVEAYNGVGVTFYARGDLDEALAWYKRALDVDPGFGDAFYNMGCAYSLRGDKDLALRYLRLAALHHYAEKDQLLNDPDLASLQGEPGLSAIVALMEAERGTSP